MTDKSLAQIMYETYWINSGTAGYHWDRLPQAARDCWFNCERAVYTAMSGGSDPETMMRDARKWYDISLVSVVNKDAEQAVLNTIFSAIRYERIKHVLDAENPAPQIEDRPVNS